MVNALLYKNTGIKIRKSFGRFFSLLLIILLGVGFFVGIRESAPDIIDSVSRYAGSYQLTNLRVVSTMGLTDDDVGAVRNLPDVKAAVPGYTLDVLSQGKAVRVQSIETAADTFKLTQGRLPKSDAECVADGRRYRIGDKIKITEDVGGKLKGTAFTVVGLAVSPLFLSQDYGSTTIGDGKLFSFLFINRDAFTMEAYSQIDVLFTGTENTAAFSQKYDDTVAALKNELTKLKPIREDARYQMIYKEADQKIRQQENTLQSEKEKGVQELSSAKAKLDANASQLNKAKEKLAENKKTLQDQTAAQNAQFQSAQTQIDSGWDQVNAALQSSGIEQSQLAGKIGELHSAIEALQSQQSQFTAGSPEYARLGAQIQQYSASYQGLVALQQSIQDLTARQSELNQGIAAFHTQAASAQDSIARGEAELAQSQKKLDDGYAEYQKNNAQFTTGIADAQAKIQSARAQLSAIQKPSWSLLERKDIINGYGDLKSAANTIEVIASILPLFFILIVALMTSNTMARMIAEERGELGTLASLGFCDRDIVLPYLFYVLSATVLGTAGGFFLGCTVIPKIVYACFPYVLPPIVLRYDMVSFLLILAAAGALMTSVTVFFCRRELKEKPASLMRPVPPKNGQTILLEKISFLWKHLSFTWKVTMRNIFRYKSRVLMMIVGIAGCTALLLTGFGIRDCIDGVARKQYGGIFRYDDLIVLKNETQSIGGSLKTLLEEEQIKNPALLRQEALTCVSSGKSVDAYLIVPQDDTAFARYFALKSKLTGAGISPGNQGVIISHRLSEIFGVGKGEKLTIEDADHHSHTLTVSDVAENYIQNYIYMGKDTYSRIFGRPLSCNIVVSAFSGDEKALASRLIGGGQILSVNFTDDILRQAASQNGSLNGVVLLLIGVSSMLAILVLYNLTSINISERIREIATLKVLGFTDGETNEYIYREAFLLSLLSVGIGLLCGIGLHHFVMSFIERDAYEYFHTIKGLSFLWTALISMAFSALMQLVTYCRLRKIDMVESLKSVE